MRLPPAVLRRLVWLRALRNRAIAIAGGKTVGVRLLIEREGRVLLIRHSYGDRRVWRLPGGAVDWREEPSAAALREAREETGIGAVEGLRLLRVYRHTLDWGDDIVAVYAARTREAGRVASPEIAELRWADPGALPDDTSEATRIAISANFAARAE